MTHRLTGGEKRERERERENVRMFFFLGIQTLGVEVK